MANTPSINPTQISARNTEGGNRFNHVLFSTLDALEESKIPFVVIGGVAASGLGRPRSTHDIDIFVRPEDAESTVQALDKKGFRTEKTDIEWLFKAFMDDILVDIVFRSKGDIYFDEEMQAHQKLVEFHGRKIPLVSPEDLIIIKCAVHYEGGPHHWHDALAILSHATIDWNYLLKRARRAPRRLLSLLLYAQSSDILIPNSIIISLFRHIFNDDNRLNFAPPAGNKVLEPLRAVPENKKEDYLLEHLVQSLAEDERTAQQDLKILLEGSRIVVRGECQTEERRAAVLDLIRRLAPHHEIQSQLQVMVVDRPLSAEAIS